MREPIKIDKVLLRAFVDDEIDTASHEAIIKAMDKDEGLRRRSL